MPSDESHTVKCRSSSRLRPGNHGWQCDGADCHDNGDRTGWGQLSDDAIMMFYLAVPKITAPLGQRRNSTGFQLLKGRGQVVPCILTTIELTINAA
jgi:hypothetical protein